MNAYNHYLKQSIGAGNDVASLGWLLTSHNKSLGPSKELLWYAIEKNRAVVVTEWAELFPDMFCGLSVQKVFDHVHTPEMAYALTHSPIDWEEEIDQNGVVVALGDAWIERFPFLHEELAHQRLPEDIIEQARKRYETISARLAPWEQSAAIEPAYVHPESPNTPKSELTALGETEDCQEFMVRLKHTED